MKKLSVAIAALLSLMGFVAFPKAKAKPLKPELSAAQMIEAADAIRNPQQPFSLNCNMVEYQSGTESNQMDIKVFSKKEGEQGQFRSLVRFLAPAKDRGKLMLKDENIIWFYDPSSKASVRISPQQRLIGQASNGDVVTVNFAHDYTAKLDKAEAITDPLKKEHQCNKLNLVATSDSATYHNIEYWVEVDTNQPIKGKFYSESGHLLKIIYYQGYQKILDANRPTELLIIDGLNKNLVTKMTLHDYSYEKFLSL